MSSYCQQQSIALVKFICVYVCVCGGGGGGGEQGQSSYEHLFIDLVFNFLAITQGLLASDVHHITAKTISTTTIEVQQSRYIMQYRNISSLFSSL